MSHRFHSRRGTVSITSLVLLVVAGLLAAVVIVRASPGAAGVTFGQCEAEIIEQHGEPSERWEAGCVVALTYPHAQFWLRKDRVYSIVVDGDTSRLYAESCVRYGPPVGQWGGRTIWLFDDVLASLHENRMTITHR